MAFLFRVAWKAIQDRSPSPSFNLESLDEGMPGARPRVGVKGGEKHLTNYRLSTRLLVWLQDVNIYRNSLLIMAVNSVILLSQKSVVLLQSTVHLLPIVTLYG